MFLLIQKSEIQNSSDQTGHLICKISHRFAVVITENLFLLWTSFLLSKKASKSAQEAEKSQPMIKKPENEVAKTNQKGRPFKMIALILFGAVIVVAVVVAIIIEDKRDDGKSLEFLNDPY